MVLLEVLGNVLEVGDGWDLVFLEGGQLRDELGEMLVKRWRFLLIPKRVTECACCFICFRRSVTSEFKCSIQTDCVTLLLYESMGREGEGRGGGKGGNRDGAGMRSVLEGRVFNVGINNI
jgi:hypothetical protein